MGGLVESIEYYYDEDFSIPFDIGISEENNNSNVNQEYTYFRCMDITDDDEENDQDEYYNDEIDGVIMPEHIFSQKCPQSAQNAVRLSCSSSPNSASSTANNIDGYNRLYFESFTHNMSFTESTYSLKSRVPLFKRSNKNILANYHLHFAPDDSLIVSYNNGKDVPSHDLISSPQTNATDSGKCSAATTDSILKTDDPMTFFHGLRESQTHLLKPEVVLWRQIKFLMLYHFAGWSLLRLFRKSRKKSQSFSGSTTDQIETCRLTNNRTRSKRWSCSVLEVYNGLHESERRLAAMINHTDQPQPLCPSKNHVSCQFPPRNRAPIKTTRQIFDYPGIGRLMMPKPTRLKSAMFLSPDLHSQLSFLQTSNLNQSESTFHKRTNENRSSHKPINYHHNRDLSNDTNDATLLLKPCLRKDDEPLEPKTITLRHASHKSISAADNFKRKSVSFHCPRLSVDNTLYEMKEIPRKWGLNGSETRSPSTDMMAIFECGRRDSLMGYAGVHDSCVVGDDTARFREMVNDVLRAVRQINERFATCNNTSDNSCSNDINKTFNNQLNALCELISSGDGLDTPLATAIDNLITLLSDGLVVTSFSSKKVRVSSSTNKAAMRLWLLIEETCRISSANTGHRLELSHVLREVRYMASIATSNKDYHLRLRAFVANALKAGLLHVWMRSVVANDTALQRFYCPEAFLRQARSGQSDALAALTVSLKTLTVGQSTPVTVTAASSASSLRTPIINKPVFPPPVKIARRRFLPPSPALKRSAKPLYNEETTTTESESYADESHSSQSPPPATQPPQSRDISNNNGVCYQPKSVKKSSTSSNLSPIFIDSQKSSPLRKPVKSNSNHNCKNGVSTRPGSAPLKTIRNQPLLSKIKSSKP